MLSVVVHDLEDDDGPPVVISLQPITTPEPRLRYAVSWGGQELAALHDRIDDDAWVGLGAIDDDEEYARRFQDLFGLDIGG